jgi:hypothetical protein
MEDKAETMLMLKKSIPDYWRGPGKIMLSISAVSPPVLMPEEKTLFTNMGICSRISGTTLTPKPNPRDTARIIDARFVKLTQEIILIPATVREAGQQPLADSTPFVDFSDQQQSAIATDITAAEVGHDLSLAQAAKLIARQVTLCLGRKKTGWLREIGCLDSWVIGLHLHS